MKKLFLLFVATATLSFVSCNNNNQEGSEQANTDSTTVEMQEDTLANDTLPQEVAEGLQDVQNEAPAQVDNTDPNAQATTEAPAVDNAQAQGAQGNADPRVQDAKDAVKDLKQAGKDAVQDVKAGKSAKEIGNNLKQAGKDALDKAGQDAKDLAKEKTNEAIEKGKEKANEALNKAKEAANKAMNK